MQRNIRLAGMPPTKEFPMSLFKATRWMPRALSAALAGALSTATGTHADIIKLEDMLHGITIIRAQCTAIAQTVWISTDGQDFCVRYYLSTAGGEGRIPVVFLQGDRFGRLDLATNSYPTVPDDQKKDIDTNDLLKTADGFSRMAKTTAIYLARIGVDGTSGSHVARKTWLELHLLNAALEAIKQRHGFAGFHLVGQSGGSKLVGGLIGLRPDIACAVSGSGPLSEPVSNQAAAPGRSYFDAADAISVAARNPSLRLFVITDPMDRAVGINQQTPYVEKMRKRGRLVSQLFVQAIDDDHHGTVEYARMVVAGCALERSDAEIARAVDSIVRRNADMNERKRREQAAKGSIGIAAQQTVPNLRSTGIVTRSFGSGI
jgi:hypothetical protein